MRTIMTHLDLIVLILVRPSDWLLHSYDKPSPNFTCVKKAKQALREDIDTGSTESQTPLFGG